MLVKIQRVRSSFENVSSSSSEDASSQDAVKMSVGEGLNIFGAVETKSNNERSVSLSVVV